MKKHRIGVIGAGAIAQFCHIPGYAAASNCELTAIADPEEECLKMVRDAGWRFEREYRGHREMLAAEKLDAVSVCTPNKFHAEIAIDCLNAGCDILLEKPIAMNMTEAMRIRDAAQKNNRRVMVGFSHRFNDLNQAAKKAIGDGCIGRPYMIRVRFAHSGPWPGWAKTDWFYNPQMAGGGALMDMAVHAFDLIQWYIGPVKTVSALTETLRKDIAVDDNVAAWVRFQDRCMGYIDCGWTSTAGFSGVEIMGDNGYICVDYNDDAAIMHHGVCTPDGKREMTECTLAKGYEMPPWGREMAYFTSLLDSNASFSPDLNSGIETLKLVLAAYKSSRTGQHIELNEVQL